MDKYWHASKSHLKPAKGAVIKILFSKWSKVKLKQLKYLGSKK